jgi:uncharacterized protein (TIGR00730 family)
MVDCIGRGSIVVNAVGVFCGSSTGTGPECAALARTLGAEIARRDMTLVYGGGKVGLMGILADAAIAHGGRVIGVIPKALMDKELAHTGISDLRITRSMHERKALMEELADGFIALPGGFGTLDEFCEILTWAQLGIHRKPCGLLDTEDGYFAHLRRFFDHAVTEGFIRPEHRALVLEDTSAASLLDRMATFEPACEGKWTDISAPVPEA